jgi:NAD(P)-dependent dehydrogenase (short-subunit alcohol dehydrogenase family)
VPRVTLVTGANKGIGFEIARGLAALGDTVLLGARNVERGEAAARALAVEGLDVRFLHLDITDEVSVQAAAKRVETDHGHLDVLVNNAAVKLEFHPAPPRSGSVQVVRETYETNVFGTMAITLALLPLLLASRAGRIVNLTSGLGSMGLASDPKSLYSQIPLLGYSTSKAAVNAFTVQLANDLRDTAVKVNAADPGFTRSDMTRGQGPLEPQVAAQVAIGLATLSDDGPTGTLVDAAGTEPW